MTPGLPIIMFLFFPQAVHQNMTVTECLVQRRHGGVVLALALFAFRRSCNCADTAAPKLCHCGPLWQMRAKMKLNYLLGPWKWRFAKIVGERRLCGQYAKGAGRKGEIKVWSLCAIQNLTVSLQKWSASLSQGVQIRKTWTALVLGAAHQETAGDNNKRSTLTIFLHHSESISEHICRRKRIANLMTALGEPLTVYIGRLYNSKNHKTTS